MLARAGTPAPQRIDWSLAGVGLSPIWRTWVGTHNAHWFGRVMAQRILVLGSAPHSRDVDAYAWDALPSPLTVADYDVVILNLVPLGADALLARCDRATFPSDVDFSKLIFSQGSTVIFIGSPANIEIELKTRSGDHSVSRLDPKLWLPMAPVFRSESGTTIRLGSEFRWYFEKVRQWSFYADDHFEDFERPDWFERIGFPEANRVLGGLGSIAETRFGRAIAFYLHYELWKIGKGGGKRKISSSGHVIWLPPATEVTDYEAVNLILAKRFGIGVEQEAPAWVGGYTLPRQVEVQSRMESVRQQARDILAQLGAAETDLEHERRYSRLLYEQGDPLENIVWSVLEELGAIVERPTDRGKHDGRLVDPNGRNAVLEIKGRTKAIGLSDVRQCEQWKQDAIEETKQKFKGLLIGNAHCGAPLEKRDDWFAPNAVDLAERYGIGLIKTSSLFRAIQEVQEANFDQDAFWDAIFSAKGECPLPDLAEPPTSAE